MIFVANDRKQYMINRKKYTRPQALLFTQYPGEVEDGFLVPRGVNRDSMGREHGSSAIAYNGGDTFEPVEWIPGYDVSHFGPDMLVTSDDNRDAINMDYTRIESRKRMINGRMRSVYIADKLKISVSWKMLPSRAFDRPFIGSDIGPGGINDDGTFNKTKIYTKKTPDTGDIPNAVQYTTDGGAGGMDLLRWYKDSPGSFWVFLAYDHYDAFNNVRNVFAPDSDEHGFDIEPVKGETEFDAYNKYHYCSYSQQVEVFFDSFDYSIEKRGNYDFWDVSLTLEEA